MESFDEEGKEAMPFIFLDRGDLIQFYDVQCGPESALNHLIAEVEESGTRLHDVKVLLRRPNPWRTQRWTLAQLNDRLLAPKSVLGSHVSTSPAYRGKWMEVQVAHGMTLVNGDPEPHHVLEFIPSGTLPLPT